MNVDPEVAMVQALQGVRIQESEYVPRGEVYALRGNADDGPALAMHPLTRWALSISLDLGLPMWSRYVREQALVCWVTERAERMASSSIRGMDDMVRGFDLRAAHYHRVRWCEVARQPHAYRYEGDGLLTLVQMCPDCGQSATDESIARAGWRGTPRN